MIDVVLQMLSIVFLGVWLLVSAVVAYAIGLHVWSWAEAPFQPPRIRRTFERDFAFLVTDAGMRCAECTYHWRTFGNIVTRFEGPDLFATFVRDRLEWTFDIGHRVEPRRIYDLRNYIDMLGTAEERALARAHAQDPAMIGMLAARCFPRIVEHLRQPAKRHPLLEWPLDYSGETSRGFG